MITSFDWLRRITWQRIDGLVFSDWIDRFETVLVRKVSGTHIEKTKTTRKWVSGWVGTGCKRMY